MKLFSIEVTTVEVVVAENENEAIKLANEDENLIMENADWQYNNVKEIDFDSLPEGWDDMCVPYGLDGNTRIKDLRQDS